MSEKCCNRVGVQSTHWEGCHEVPPSCAAVTDTCFNPRFPDPWEAVRLLFLIVVAFSLLRFV